MQVVCRVSCVVGRESAPAPLVLQFIERILAIRPVPVQLATLAFPPLPGVSLVALAESSFDVSFDVVPELWLR